MAVLDEKALRSLVRLLDDEDPKSLDLVRRHILDVGDPILPYLEELRGEQDPDLAAKADSISRELRFRQLREDFTALARAPEPDLETGAFLVARFAYPGLDPEPYVTWLDRVAAKIEQDLPPEADLLATFQQLNLFLFQALNFSGNQKHYYDPDNSYLNRVIETRRGIPVTLSVLYLLLAKRLRLPVYGVATPGHFLVALRSGAHSCFIDTFHRGRLMDLSDVRRMLIRSGYEFRPEFVARCSSRDIIIRMMRNLISVYEKAGSPERAERLGSLVEILLMRGKKRVA
ncbi:MAG: hypothetical protein HY549_09980 [Elusimicrobia bacterium]|nr:hypothetical protein [Elusimicrobiota bacterium]